MPYRNGKLVKWKVKIKGIKSLLNEDTSSEYVIHVSHNINNILSSDKYKSYFQDCEGEDLVHDFLFVDKANDLNNLLDDLYDYCDANLIWIE